MPFDAGSLVARSFAPVAQSYGPRDSLLYALGIGLGMQPTAPEELRHLLEDPQGQLKPVPTFVCVLAFPAPWSTDPSVGADWRRVVHVEQRVDFVRPLPPQGHVRAQARVERVTDKGAGRGALVQAVRTVEDATTGEALAHVTMVSLARGDGGCGDASRSDAHALPELPDTPDRVPEHAIEVQTSPQAALIYRESGDRNTLHVDPVVARAAGFDRPILHGLCTFGLASHHVMALTGCDAPRLATIGCRFTDVVYPGDRLRIEAWRAPGGTHFRVGVPARNSVALSRGFAALRP